MKIYEDIIQGSDEWHQVRIGKISASRFGVAMSKPRASTKEPARPTLIKRLGMEHESRLPDESESFNNGYMENGTDLEDEARRHYEKKEGVKVQQVGFIEMTEFIGASPDGLIGDDGGLELKCPKRTTHKDNIITGKVPSGYIPQIQGNMWVSNRKWWDYMSYCPSYKAQPELIIRVMRDEEYIKDLAEKINRFVIEMKMYIDKSPACPF